APAGEDVIQVEYIGEGTPEDAGGGAPEAEIVVELPEPPAGDAAASPPAAAAPAVAMPAEPAPAPQPPEEPQPLEEPRPQPPAEPPARQPLQVTETPVPDSDFVVPPTTPPELERVPPETPTPTV